MACFASAAAFCVSDTLNSKQTDLMTHFVQKGVALSTHLDHTDTALNTNLDHTEMPGRLHAPCQSAGRPSERRKGALGAADTALETGRFSLCTHSIGMPWRIVRCLSIATLSFIQKKLKIHLEPPSLKICFTLLGKTRVVSKIYSGVALLML